MKVTLPQTAIDTLKNILNDNPDRPSNIRIYFAGYACSGASFGVALDEQSSDDFEYEIDGLKFIMSQSEYEEYGDITIEDNGYGFRVSVQNATEGGGCGGCTGCSN